MKLHQRLLLPLFIIFSGILLYFTLVWIPALKADAEAEFQATTTHHLDSVREILIPLLLTSQIGVIHENMDALLTGNPEWKSITITDAAGRTIYPMRGSAPVPAQPEQVLVTVERAIQLAGTDLARLSVAIDRAPSTELQRHRFMSLSVAFGAFAFAMLMVAVLIMEAAVLVPVRQLAQASKAMAERDFDAPLPAPRSDEIGDLISTFMSMRAARQQAEKSLAASMRERELILGSPQEGICCISADGDISFLNPAAQQMLKLTADEAIGSCMHDKHHHTYPDGTPFPRADCPMYQTLADGLPREVAGEHYWRTDGSSFPVEYSVTAIQQDGAITGAVIVFRDITERQATELALRTKTEALERSNVELEQFAYVASHDLREPLRMVISYMSLLERRYAPQLDADARDFIAFARDGAERMNGLIMDLLEYSRIGRIAPPKENVTIRDLVDVSLGSLALEANAQQADIRIDDSVDAMPALFGCRQELARLLQNLLENALKYHHPDRPPSIAISAQHAGGAVTISVADNGIGIAAEYFDRIFLIFQRLHTREQYPGTGIGLAICKRIAELHGGAIWLDSAPDQGSTFHIRLPVARGGGQPPPTALSR